MTENYKLSASAKAVLLDCEKLGFSHKFDFFIAEHGVQVFKCTECKHIEDVVEDSQP